VCNSYRIATADTERVLRRSEKNEVEKRQEDEDGNGGTGKASAEYLRRRNKR